MASITKRTLKDGSRVYEIRVSRGRDPITGKQLPMYTQRYKPPVSLSDKTALKNAQRMAGEFEAECRAGRVMTKSEAKEYEIQRIREEELKPTFQKYVEIYLKEMEIRSPNTIANYRVVLRRAGETLNTYKIEDITTLIMKDYFLDLQTNGKNEKTGEALAHKTIIKHYIVLHSFFQAAADNNIIVRSPMQDMKRPKPRKDDREEPVQACSPEQVQYIFNCAEKEPLKWRAMIHFFIESGCRRGEVVALRWKHIDLESGRITIEDNAQYTAGRGTYITTPKSGKARIVMLSTQGEAIQLLKELKKEQRSMIFKGIQKLNDFVFTQENGDMMNPQAPTAYISRFCKKYDMKGIHPHMFRHTFATMALQSGVDVATVSAMVGHSEVSTTLNTYTHTNEAVQSQASEKIATKLYKGILTSSVKKA
ncbi:MAG: site-specific integrase [Clostridia bacterium]|nr:site-specific integrase [Clostridia bacterium]